MRSRILPIAFVALVLLAGCTAPLQSDGPAANAADVTPVAGDGSTASSEATTISVTGSGEASADADLAVLTVSVVSTADTADAARSQTATDAERMRAALRNASVPDDAVTTVSYAISPLYDYSKDRQELRGYRAVHTFRIEVAPDRAGEIVDVAVGNGASQVDGVQFTLTEKTRADLRAQAITRAVEAARADADAVASASDLKVTGVRTASTSNGYTPYYGVKTVEAGAASGGAPTTLEPGPVTVSATVSVTYTAA
ncbi:MAG: SIMPL domain-containing protein [Salinigranum sp.]